jgi:hypothetical protein
MAFQIHGEFLKSSKISQLYIFFFCLSRMMHMEERLGNPATVKSADHEDKCDAH